MRDDRRMTFIVVPHAGTRDLTTRSYEISYRSLRRWVIAGGVVALLLVAMAASWFYLAAQVGRAQLLERQVRELQQQVARAAELEREIEELEARKRQID